MITVLTEIIPNPILHFLVTLPLILIAFFKSKSKDYFLILLFFAILVLDNICLRAWIQIGILNKNWNWIGKISEFIFAIAFIYFFKKISFKDYGFTSKIDKSSLKPIVRTLVIFAIILSGLKYVSDGFSGINFETLLFEATMPGLSEELFFRGVLLGLFNNAFGKQWKVFGTAMGWGVVITSVLFGLVHGLTIDKASNLHFSLGSIFISTIFGFVMAWAKERSGSLIPAIVGHNFINFLGSF